MGALKQQYWANNGAKTPPCRAGSLGEQQHWSRWKGETRKGNAYSSPNACTVPALVSFCCDEGMLHRTRLAVLHLPHSLPGPTQKLDEPPRKLVDAASSTPYPDYRFRSIMDRERKRQTTTLLFLAALASQLVEKRQVCSSKAKTYPRRERS
jgi:hypothetical protein